MKKTITQYHYSELSQLYVKLKSRLAKHFKNGSFHQLGKAQQRKLLVRIEKLEAQLSRFGNSLKYAGAALMLGGVLLTSEAQAQFATNGTEFLVNTYTTNDQRYPSVAKDSDGDFVVAWQSASQDGSGYGIYAQRFNALGAAQGGEFQVNTYTTGNQRYPSVAIDSDGDFVVAWQSQNQDGDYEGVYAQRFNASGVVQGTEFLVNTYTTNYQQNASIAMDDDGDFVVVWNSYGQDGGYNGIYGQRFNAAGAAQGGEFQVNTFTTSNQSNPSVAIDSDGDFVVVWDSFSQDGDFHGVYGQRYNASGATQGSEFLVNTYTTDRQEYPSVAMDSDGDFIVAWQSQKQDDPTFHGVYAQRYNASGTAQGSEFLVNTYTTERQKNPVVAMDSDGDFVVVWDSRLQDGGGFYGMHAQRYNALGVAQGSEFQVNTYTGGNEREQSVSMDSDGDFTVVYSNRDQDGSFYGVYSQRYTGGFPTGVLNSTFSKSVNLYPSPAKGEVKVNLEGTADVRLFDLAGHEVSSQTISSNIINLSGIKSGIYMVEITQGEQKALKKLVVE